MISLLSPGSLGAGDMGTFLELLWSHLRHMEGFVRVQSAAPAAAATGSAAHQGGGLWKGGSVCFLIIA